MNYHEEAVITISWDAQSECVVSQLKGFAHGEGYRVALDKGLELLEQKASRKWLGDMREGAAMDPQDLKWTQEDWRPRAVAAGLQWTAMVMTENALVQMQMNRLTKMVEQVEGRSIETAYFDDIDEAKVWVYSK